MKKLVDRDSFIKGYVCAVANLIRERDTPAAAKGLMESIGDCNKNYLKIIGVSKEDIKILVENKII